jgi:hypothetical protein
MVRLKSIDNFRGIAVIAMLWMHLSEWWLSGVSKSFIFVPLLVTQYGFWVSYQFISGISRYLFYRTGGLREKSSEINLELVFFICIIDFINYDNSIIKHFQKDEIFPWSSILGIELYDLNFLTRFQRTS